MRHTLSSTRLYRTALLALLGLLSAGPASAGEDCETEAILAVTRAEKLSGAARAAELDKALAFLDSRVGEASPLECQRLLGAVLLWRANAEALTPKAQRALRERSMAVLEAATNLHPDDTATWQLRAQVEEEAGLYARAANTWHSLALLQPYNLRAHAARVRLLGQAGKAEEALAAAREWVRVKPWDWEAHLALGLRLEAQGQWEEALTEYGRATSLDEGVDNAPLAQGALYARLSRWKEAEAAFAKVDAVEYLLGWYSQGVCRVKLGDKRGARDWVAKLKTQEGGGALARRLLAFIKAPGTPPVLGLPAYAEP